MEQEIFEKTLVELREYAKEHGMVLTAGNFSVTIVKDITKEVEECVFDAVWQELKEAEEVCEKNCLISHKEPTKWQRECIETCIRCWEMTKRGECAKIIGAKQVEHIHAMETIMKLRNLWYRNHWYVDIDEKVLFVAVFKPPSEL
jgi:16S rRNA C1402 (ribose-2'-O) methylase RsmI